MSPPTPDETVYQGAPVGLDPPTGARVARPASLVVAVLFATLGLVAAILRLGGA